MQTFEQCARQQSSQLEQAAHAERQYLTNTARLEVESSRQELVWAQNRFQEAPSQQSAQINSLSNALSHAELRDGAVREDLRSLRNESESYSRMLAHAEESWRAMQAETRSSDQVFRTQRSELHAALSELSINRGTMDELHAQFSSLEQAQAAASQECRWLNAELNSERHRAPRPDAGHEPDAPSGTGSSRDRLASLAQRFEEFHTTAEQTLSEVQAKLEEHQERFRNVEAGIGVVQTDMQTMTETVEAMQQSGPQASVPPPPEPGILLTEGAEGDRRRAADADDAASAGAGSKATAQDIGQAIQAAQKGGRHN